MPCELYRIRVDLEDGKFFYAFYLKTSSGLVTKVLKNVYKDKNGNYHDNYNILLCNSKEISDLKEIL